MPFLNIEMHVKKLWIDTDNAWIEDTSFELETIEWSVLYCLIWSRKVKAKIFLGYLNGHDNKNLLAYNALIEMARC